MPHFVAFQSFCGNPRIGVKGEYVMELSKVVDSTPGRPGPGEGVFTAILLCVMCVIAHVCIAGLVYLINIFWIVSLLVLSFDFPNLKWLLYVPAPLGLTSFLIIYSWKANKAPSPYFAAIRTTLAIALVLTVVILLRYPFEM
jgi:hypothetical protein